MIFSQSSQTPIPAPGNSLAFTGANADAVASPGTLAAGTATLINRAGTLSTLVVKGDTNAVTTAEVFTVEKNGADTAIVATAAVGQSVAEDLTHSVAVVKGDYISLRHNANATPTFTAIAFALYFTPS